MTSQDSQLSGKAPDNISTRRKALCRSSRETTFLLACFAGVCVGFALGFGVSAVAGGPGQSVIIWLGLPGELYMRMMKAAILPLVISSIIAGTAGLNPKVNGRISAVAFSYIIATNLIGAITGAVMAIVINPGRSGLVSSEGSKLSARNLRTEDLFIDFIRNLVPDNLVTATFQQTQTQYREREVQAANGSTDNATVVLERVVSAGGGANALGLVVACAALGMAASQSKKAGEPFLAFFRSCSEIITFLLHRIIWFTPVGVSSLIASSVAATKNVVVTVRGLGLFVLAETLGNVVLAIGVSPLVYFLVVRRNPFSFLAGASRAVIAGVAPPSSAIALPEIIKYLEEKIRVDPRVSRFVVPFAVTLNRDGSVMFITLTSLYIAQLQGDVTADVIVLVMLAYVDCLSVSLLATASSLAIPAVPSASFVTILLILSSINVTPANIGILMAIEWFSDRIRTGANVVSHTVCGAITNKLCMRSLLATELQATPLRHVENMVRVEEPDSEKDETH